MIYLKCGITNRRDGMTEKIILPEKAVENQIHLKLQVE